MLRIAILIGSTRPGRNGEAVGKWVHEIAGRRTDASVELVDLLDFNLPVLDEPVPSSAHKYTKAHTQAWSDKIASFDAYVVVTAEYQHGIPGGLKNALDYLHDEWHNKVVGFVSYGSAGGVRAVEHLRLVFAELEVATVRAQVFFSLLTDFENLHTFKPPAESKVQQLNRLLDQLVAWGTALKGLRDGVIKSP